MQSLRLLKKLGMLFWLLFVASNLLACSNISTTKASILAIKASPTSLVYAETLQRDVAYGPLPAERLDLCRPVNAEHLRPGVLVIHGGGWKGGDKQTYDSICQWLATQGFVAATMNYRLAPAYTWPAQLVDAQLAVRWLRGHAADLELDPGRLCAWGSSAGAHLALFLGSLATIHPGDEAKLLADQSSRVSCVVDEFGPSDLTAPLGPVAISLLQTLFHGATLQSNPALYHEASPIFSISAHSAPTLIVQGSRDDLILPTQSVELQQALQRLHVPVEYDAYDGGHAFTGISASQRQKIRRYEAAFIIANLLSPSQGAKTTALP